MATRIKCFIILFGWFFCQAQKNDSLESAYQKYYKTKLLAVSPSGRYLVLNHYNTFGKNENELFDTVERQDLSLGKYTEYKFLGEDRLMMSNRDHIRFQNLKTNQYNELKGNYVKTVVGRADKILLYNTSSKDMVLASKNGDVIWKETNVDVYRFDEKLNRLMYAAHNTLKVINLVNQKMKIYNADSTIQWISSDSNSIYFANITPSQLELYTIDLSSDELNKQVITSPDSFEFAGSLSTYFEIREDGHFLLPLYFKSKLAEKQDSELRITYSNMSSKIDRNNHHLGIFNVGNREWNYLPSTENKLPIYKFLNDGGDFVVYDESVDVVEDKDNVVVDLSLVLDYGKSSHLLLQKRSSEGDYLWDGRTEQFIYFDSKRWRCYHIKSGTDHELMPINTDGWASSSKSGLTEVPEVDPVLVKGMSVVILSNQFDYFTVDLTTHGVKRITKGEEEYIKYDLQLSKDHFSKSPWNLRFAKVDLDQGLIFKLLNTLTYCSRFATYFHKVNKTKIYNEGHYREAVPFRNGMIFTSEFALEPFRITKVEKKRAEVVYESLKAERKLFETMRCQIYQYTTPFGNSNAALLFPANYDKRRKYPMIVNVYERQSNNVLLFTSPFLTARDGFNYMHYLLNGYFVLLPDLQYDIANIQNSVVESLEKSIDAALSLGSIDEKNVGILGLSYGGYETGLALTGSNYFKTGVAGVMVSDLVSNALSNSEIASEPNYRRVESKQFRMKNSLFENWNGYLENSPIYHLKNVNAPLLIWTGSKDTNVSPAQSKMFFLGIKRLQKKAVLLEYANESHTLDSEKNQLDLNIRIWQWFDYHLKKKKGADWIIPVTK